MRGMCGFEKSMRARGTETGGAVRRDEDDADEDGAGDDEDLELLLLLQLPPYNAHDCGRCGGGRVAPLREEYALALRASGRRAIGAMAAEETTARGVARRAPAAVLAANVPAREAPFGTATAAAADAETALGATSECAATGSPPASLTAVISLSSSRSRSWVH